MIDPFWLGLVTYVISIQIKHVAYAMCSHIGLVMDAMFWSSACFSHMCCINEGQVHYQVLKLNTKTLLHSTLLWFEFLPLVRYICFSVPEKDSSAEFQFWLLAQSEFEHACLQLLLWWVNLCGPLLCLLGRGRSCWTRWGALASNL